MRRSGCRAPRIASSSPRSWAGWSSRASSPTGSRRRSSASSASRWISSTSASTERRPGAGAGNAAMAALKEIVDSQVIDQHLIDPEICIRCNTCESTCTIGAITHDDRNYVVDPSICNLCMDCVPPCPTGAIDNWRKMLRSRAYSVEEQFGWDELPAQVDLDETGPDEDAPAPAPRSSPVAAIEPGEQRIVASEYASSLPPWSAAHPFANLYLPKAPTEATVVGNVRITEAGRESETHHIVLDFGGMPFPVLEGQSIGIVPPGV